jgi:hypothetical protein
MTETQQQDEVERRARDCLAKAAYLEWVASTTSDTQLKTTYTRLSFEWQKEAENKSSDHVGGRD